MKWSNFAPSLCARLALSFFVFATFSCAAVAARKALVIGNDAYEAIDKLRNARADADAMATALKKAGYIVTLEKDRSLRQMRDAVRSFRAGVEGGDQVVVFFAGHGVQIAGMNYLLPVDVRAQTEDQVRDDSIALGDLLADIARQKPALTLAVIDACRNNPFPKKGRAIGGRGLTGVSGATGQMVVYSAGEGQEALDRMGDNDPVRNGLFTRVFIREMERSGVPVTEVVRNVREEVYRLALGVGREQVPAIYDQVLGRFYFYAPTSQVLSQEKATPPTHSDAIDLAFWNSIKDSTNRKDFEAYLQQFPNGRFASLATNRVGSSLGSKSAETQASENEKQLQLTSFLRHVEPADGRRATDLVDKMRLQNFRVKYSADRSIAKRSVKEVRERLKSGALHFLVTNPAAWAEFDSKFMYLDATPFGPEAVDYLTWRRSDSVQLIAQSLYASLGLVGFPCGLRGPFGTFWLKKPWTKPDDIANSRIAATAPYAALLAKMGAAVVTVDEASQLKISSDLDGAVLSAVDDDVRSGVLDQFPSAEISYQLASSGGVDLVADIKAWDGLTEAEQNRLRRICDDTLSQDVGDYHKRASSVWETMIKRIKVYKIPDRIDIALRATWASMLQESVTNSHASDIAAQLANRMQNTQQKAWASVTASQKK